MDHLQLGRKINQENNTNLDIFRISRRVNLLENMEKSPKQPDKFAF